jgi:hypothetical protein
MNEAPCPIRCQPNGAPGAAGTARRHLAYLTRAVDLDGIDQAARGLR